MIATLVSIILRAISDVLGLAVRQLPDDPVLLAIMRWSPPYPGAAWLTWLLPIRQLATLMAAWAAITTTVWAVVTLLRWAKVVS